MRCSGNSRLSRNSNARKGRPQGSCAYRIGCWCSFWPSTEGRQAWDRGRSLGHVSLRRLLWRQAQHNPAQARFLGKHWLGMDGKPDHHTTEDAPPVLSREENVARIHELLAEARRRSNPATDHERPDPAASAIPPGDLADDLSDALQDLQLPDEILDWLDLRDSELSEAIENLQLGDDPLGALDLCGLEDPGDSSS